MQKIGIIGSGMVGKTLADGFIKHGYQVRIGTGSPSKLEEWDASSGEHGSVGSFEDAAEFGALIVLAVKGHAAKDIMNKVHDQVQDKIVLDACNPIDEKQPPVNGVLQFFTDINYSLMEELQTAHPGTHFVKCFSCVGAHLMVQPQLGEGMKPTMFIAGNSEQAKSEARSILDLFGWDAEDMGGVEAARAIEPLCMLWCIPGFKDNQWTHAFKLLKK